MTWLWTCQPATPLRALVTGASSGIGRALATELAGRGFSMVVSGRREEALRTLAQTIEKEYGVVCLPYPGDLTAADVRQGLLAEAEVKLGGLDLLVNNAGCGAIGCVEEIDDEAARRLIDLNFLAPVSLTRGALPLLRRSAAARKRGHRRVLPAVIFVSSIVGLVGTPYYGVYGAAKGAIRLFADSLRAEVAGDGIGVLSVMPGTTETPFFDHLVTSGRRPRLPKHRALSPQTVARRIVRALCQGRHRLLTHPESRWLAHLDRFCPSLIDWVMKHCG